MNFEKRHAVLHFIDTEINKSIYIQVKNGMEEVIFLVEESEGGGYAAKGIGVSIYTEADTLEELRLSVKDAVRCHFDDDKKRIIRCHIVKDEIFAA